MNFIIFSQVIVNHDLTDMNLTKKTFKIADIAKKSCFLNNFVYLPHIN